MAHPPNPLDFSGKTVLVIGGSSGIGNGIARLFRNHGAAVHVTGTRDSESAYPDSDFESMSYYPLDIASDDAVRDFKPDFDSLDVLVNSAGTVLYKRGEYKMDGWRHVIDVNLTGVMHTCLRFHTMLKASSGNIVLVSSMASFHATRGNPAYSASKGGLRTLTMSLAEAWARDGIRVNTIAPGFVDTKLTKITRNNRDLYEATIRNTPLGRWGEPEEMATVALFLASTMASYMTGVTIPVDGGAGLS